MREVSISIETPPAKATLDIIDHGLDFYNANFSPNF